jgi:tRNA(Ile)-lysidine synthase TilS/MesJ
MKPAQFEQKVKNTIKDYNLIKPKDKVLVACSGGKDSTVVLYLLKKFGYNVEAITIDVAIGSYTKKNLENLRQVCKNLGVKLHEISLRKKFGCSICYMKSVLKSKGIAKKSCSICGIAKRYLLNKETRKLKADKIVTGHNIDDEAQSVMMNFLRGNLMLLSRLGPLTGLIQDKKFVPRIKPLYF